MSHTHEKLVLAQAGAIIFNSSKKKHRPVQLKNQPQTTDNQQQTNAK